MSHGHAHDAAPGAQGAAPRCERGRSPLAGFILLVIRVALGALFVFAGYMKLGIPIFGDVRLGSVFLPLARPDDPLGMYAAIHGFQLNMPDLITRGLAFVIPWLEVVVGALLIVGLWTRAAALVLVLLMGAFIFGIASVMVRGIITPCTCFGPVSMFCPKNTPMGWCQLLRDVGFAGVALIVAIGGSGWLGLDALLRRTPR